MSTSNVIRRLLILWTILSLGIFLEVRTSSLVIETQACNVLCYGYTRNMWLDSRKSKLRVKKRKKKRFQELPPDGATIKVHWDPNHPDVCPMCEFDTRPLKGINECSCEWELEDNDRENLDLDSCTLWYYNGEKGSCGGSWKFIANYEPIP